MGSWVMVIVSVCVCGRSRMKRGLSKVERLKQVLNAFVSIAHTPQGYQFGRLHILSTCIMHSLNVGARISNMLDVTHGVKTGEAMNSPIQIPFDPKLPIRRLGVVFPPFASTRVRILYQFDSLNHPMVWYLSIWTHTWGRTKSNNKLHFGNIAVIILN